MYLEPWMIISLIVAFGACAVLNRRFGFQAGGTLVLGKLVEQKMIKITDEGQVKRWTPYDDVPVKTKRMKKAK